MSALRLSSFSVMVFLSATLGPPSADLQGQASKPESEPYLKEAISAVRKGDLPAAERLLKIALEKRQDSPFAHYWLGVAYMKEHRLADAEDALHKGIELRPNFPQAYDALGMLYDKQQLYSKSERSFLHALILKSRETNAIFNLGLSYMRHKRYAEALGRFDDMLKVDPHYRDVYLQRGIALS